MPTTETHRAVAPQPVVNGAPLVVWVAIEEVRHHHEEARTGYLVGPFSARGKVPIRQQQAKTRLIGQSQGLMADSTEEHGEDRIFSVPQIRSFISCRQRRSSESGGKRESRRLSSVGTKHVAGEDDSTVGSHRARCVGAEASDVVDHGAQPRAGVQLGRVQAAALARHAHRSSPVKVCTRWRLRVAALSAYFGSLMRRPS